MSGLGPLTHVVVTGAFAGVERYICQVAPLQRDLGFDVTVVGGDPAQMRRHLGPGVRFEPGQSMGEALRSLAKAPRGGIVHAHMSKADIVGALLKRRLRAALVSTRHFGAQRGTRRLSKLGLTFVERSIDAEIAISRFVADSVGGKVVVVPNGVATHDAIAYEARSKVVLVMQRLEREKDTSTAIRAFAQSHLADAGWRLEIAGRGSEDTQLRQLAVTLGVYGATMWAGFVDAPAALAARCAVHLASAVAEPFGLAVAESMAQGLPVVASDGGAHPELLGATARLFRVGDAAGAGEQLRQLADPVAAATYGAELRLRQQRLFSLESHLVGLDAVYAGLRS